MVVVRTVLFGGVGMSTRQTSEREIKLRLALMAMAISGLATLVLVDRNLGISKRLFRVS